MSERQAAWRPKPPPAVKEMVQSLSDTHLFVVHRSGPTSFLIKEEGSEVKLKVTVGLTPSCTCAGGGKCEELCIHIM
jgi:hypothetical protein